MAESTSFPLAFLIIGGVLALLVAGGIFGLVYWLMGRGRDDEVAP